MTAIEALNQLIKNGQVNNSSILAPCLTGLAHPKEQGWVMSRALLAARAALSSDTELTAAILATQDDYRDAWLPILAARCREAGELQDEAVLVHLVSRLQSAAAWVEEAFEQSSLQPTPLGEQERPLFGVTTDQSAATPMLTRVLAVAARLAPRQTTALNPMGPVDPTGARLDKNWCAGRLLVLPGGRTVGDDLLKGRAEDSAADPLVWLLGRPWALLLAMVGYAQYVWAAEGQGGLLLELPDGQSAFQPGAVEVLVMSPAGDEVRCGSLAGLLLRVMDHLQMGCFPHTPDETELNGALCPIIGGLLKRRIWQFREGGSGEQGQYQLDPAFADLCFTISGVKVFKLSGRHLWQAVRIQAQQWHEALARRGPDLKGVT